MNIIYLLLGSNIGDSVSHLELAKEKIKKETGKIIKQSAVYRTAAWGNTDQPDFLNQVLIIETGLSAQEVLKKILLIEKDMGRTRTVKNAPRIIDIDMLFFGNDIIHTEELKVPHPEIPNRRFVLEPLAELSPSFIHPALYVTIAELLADCRDELNVQKI